MTRKRLTQREGMPRLAASKEKIRKPIEGRELDGFEYDTSKAKILKKALHNINVSLGTLISAMKDISMIKGSDLTPDGKLGGKGFIMSFRDIKQAISESVGNLSDVTDTLADELTNPMWGLSSTEKHKVKKEQDKVEDQVEEAEEVIEESEDGEKDTKEDGIVEEEGGEEPEVSEEVVEEQTEHEDTEKESSEYEDIDRYRSLLSSSNDKTAGTLSRRIMANLLTGENKNG